MPYIKQSKRSKFDSLINDLIFELESPEPSKEVDLGELNYVVSKIVWMLFDAKRCYSRANELMGVLECVKQEFYRRKISSLEYEKMVENGDILDERKQNGY